MRAIRQRYASRYVAVFLMLWTSGFALQAQSEELDLKFGLQSGLSNYEETGSLFPVTSEWEAGFIGLNAVAVLRYNANFEIQFRSELWKTDSDTERWREGHLLVQENELEAAGSAWSASLVRVINPDKKIITALRAGPSIHFEKYTREDFVAYSRGQIIAREDFKIDEDVFFASFDLGLNIEATLSEKNAIAFDFEVGFVGLDQADNDAFPETIEGSGGYRLQSSIRYNRQLKKGRTLGLALLFSSRVLDGKPDNQEFRGRSTEIEWPENNRTNIGLELFWKGSF